MTDIESVLNRRNLKMPDPPARGGIYEPVKELGENFVYLSGCVPSFNGEKKFTGKLGSDLTVEQGQEAACYCILNCLANLKAKIGSLDRIKRFVKMTCFVACSENFYDHPLVANGGSRLLVDIFGEECGCCARSAVGMISLPGNVPVEIELLVELEA